jgi:hypothetical protein
MAKSKLKCKKAIGPDLRCRRTAVAEVFAKGEWHPLCHEHALEFLSHLRFLGEGRSRSRCRSRA